MGKRIRIGLAFPKEKRDHLLQTTLSLVEVQWVQIQARHEGISQAAFVRRLILDAMRRSDRKKGTR